LEDAYVFISRPYLAKVFTMFSIIPGVTCGGLNDDLSTSIFPITEDCRLILNQPFDERNVLEESFRTIVERRRDGDGVKYKIIDIDGSELSIDDLLEKYFFSTGYRTSCSIILTKLHNNGIG
jgi:hypothetical protein